MPEPKRFTALVKALKKPVSSSIAGTSSYEEKSRLPWKKSTPSVLRKAIEDGAKLLPRIYQEHYVAPLLSSLDAVMARAAVKLVGFERKKDISDRYSKTMDVLLGPIYNYSESEAVSSEIVRPLRCVLAMLSDAYRAFKLPTLNYRQIPSCLQTGHSPPLATFRHGEIVCSLLTSQDIRNMTGGTVGVVVLPEAYKDAPTLWTMPTYGFVAQELLDCIPNLLEELRNGVRLLLNVGSSRTSREHDKRSTEEVIGLLWQYWAERALGDVCGVLATGPTYGLVNAAHAAARYQANARRYNQEPDTTFPPWLGLPPSSLIGSNKQTQLPDADPFPSPILGMHFTIGVVENLTKLSPKHCEQYVSFFKALARIHASGETAIRFEGTVEAEPDLWIPIIEDLNLDSVQWAARQVGAYMATKEFTALGGRTLQEIQTWDETHEDIAQDFVTRFQKQDRRQIGIGNDAVMMAGASLAISACPEDFDKVTNFLMDGLEVSYVRDPVWRWAI